MVKPEDSGTTASIEASVSHILWTNHDTKVDMSRTLQRTGHHPRRPHLGIKREVWIKYTSANPAPEAVTVAPWSMKSNRSAAVTAQAQAGEGTRGTCDHEPVSQSLTFQHTPNERTRNTRNSKCKDEIKHVHLPRRLNPHNEQSTLFAPRKFKARPSTDVPRQVDRGTSATVECACEQERRSPSTRDIQVSRKPTWSRCRVAAHARRGCLLTHTYTHTHHCDIANGDATRLQPRHTCSLGSYILASNKAVGHYEQRKSGDRHGAHNDANDCGHKQQHCGSESLSSFNEESSRARQLERAGIGCTRIV